MSVSTTEAVPAVNSISSTAPVPAPPATVTIPVVPEPVVEERTFTADQIAKARQEEKDKLYAELKKRDDKIKEFDTFKTAFEAEAEDKARKAAAEARAEAEAEAAKKFAESDSKTLLAEAQQEWENKFQSLAAERENERTLFAKEQEYNRLKDIAVAKVNAALQNNELVPELADYVQGNNEAEIDASLEFAKQKTQQIVEGIRNAQVQARSQMPGVSPTGFAATGPMDIDSGHQTFTLEQLRDMPMGDYAKYRKGLLGAAATAGQSNRGLYG